MLPPVNRHRGPGSFALLATAVIVWVAVPARSACADRESTPASAPSRPPRVDGMYLGGVGFGTLGFARVNSRDTPNPFGGFGGSVRIGETLFPWFDLGIQLVGNLAYSSREGAAQRLGQGAFLVEAGFLPVPRIPFSIRTGLGIGGGAVREDGVAGRSGFGGAVFFAALRHEFFPVAERLRPQRGGGWSIGPELGWIGQTPAAPGRPMANTVYLGIWSGFHFGR